MFRADWRAQAPGASGTPFVAPSPSLDKIAAASQSSAGPSRSPPTPAKALDTSAHTGPVSITTLFAVQDMSSLIMSRDKMRKRVALAESYLASCSTEKVCIV